MVKKHPKVVPFRSEDSVILVTSQVKEMGAKIDMSDLEADPILAFQRK